MILKILKISFIAVFLLIILVLSFYTFKYFSIKDKTETIQTIRDTTIIYRYIQELKKDTVIKWHEKIKYINNKPEKINYQSADSHTVSDIKEKDLIFKLDRHRDNLIIKSIDINDSTIREYYFENTGRDFSLVSQKGNLYLKSRIFYFSGIRIDAVYNFSPEKNKRITLKAGTGINWHERIFLGGNIKYNFSERKFDFECSLGIKIFK